ncbi:helix-turn-helix domain-containing protein [Streptomyces sp. NPDC050263]|uniref:AraC-like ligand-binding domain-containing protein n=1 Tax=Streptomyces sp. NPDC050263 TaxID=3155037 RepID=UPI00341FD35A
MSEPSGKAADASVSLSSGGLPTPDRFPWYADVVGRNIAPYSLTSAHAHNFRAHIQAVNLGEVQVTTFSFSPLAAQRTSRHIRRADPETYQLALVHGSPMRVSQRRQETVIHTGSLVLFDTSYPMASDIPDEGGVGRATLLRLPKSLLPLPAQKADSLLSRRLTPQGVTGRLLCQYLETVVGGAAEMHPAGSYRLGTIAVDLAAMFLSEHLDAEHLLPSETRRQVLSTRIHAFIEDHLADLDLRPLQIAAHHNISVRFLHLLFSAESETVAATIRRRRLERCRADLADPRLSGRPISAIAARWGLLVPAEFSRAFRRAYGMTPREFRHEVARQAKSAL